MITISQVKSKKEISAVQDLFREFTAWSISLLEGSEKAPTFENLDEELAGLPGIYAPPSGQLLLAKQDEHPAGCVALVRHDDDICELKRLYVRPAFRGLGIGHKLVTTLMDNARQAGYKQMVLDSHISMKKAHEIYRRHGFEKVETPVDFPEVFKPYVVFMECKLVNEL